jgi:hypothetical protein
MMLLLVDGHSQFAKYRQLNATGNPPTYNFDWTVGGLTGADLAR